MSAERNDREPTFFRYHEGCGGPTNDSEAGVNRRSVPDEDREAANRLERELAGIGVVPEPPPGPRSP